MITKSLQIWNDCKSGYDLKKKLWIYHSQKKPLGKLRQTNTGEKGVDIKASSWEWLRNKKEKLKGRSFSWRSTAERQTQPSFSNTWKKAVLIRAAPDRHPPTFIEPDRFENRLKTGEILFWSQTTLRLGRRRFASGQQTIVASFGPHKFRSAYDECQGGDTHTIQHSGLSPSKLGVHSTLRISKINMVFLTSMDLE